MTNFEKEKKRLQNHWPLIGALIRRKACERLAADASPSAVPLLVEALGDSDPQVRAQAEQALRHLSHRDARNALCRIATENPAGPAARLCVQAGVRPSDPEETCLFLFVTRQMDAYFKEDFEFQGLRAAYDRASEKVRSQVMETVRSGDRRLLGFFGRRKPLNECNAAEIQLAIDSALRHRDWPRLFRVFLELPLKYSFPLLEHFRTSRWEPPEPEMKSLLRDAMGMAQGAALPQPRTDVSSSVFARWLSPAERLAGSEAELIEKLKSANPPDGVRIVGALAAVAQRSPATVKAVKENQHWLVRLAGYVTGVVSLELAESSANDPVYWVRELGNAEGALEFWPASATPAHLEQMKALPGEAWAGKLGAIRKILRLLLAQRITGGTFEEIIYEAGEFAGEFEAAE